MSKTKVKYCGEKYSVNAKKKTVVCILDFDINLLEIESVQRMLNQPEFRNYVASISSKDNFGLCEFRVVGKAKTADSDEFDEVFGKRLARTRAQEEAFNVASNIYSNLMQVIDKIVYNELSVLCDGSEEAFWKSVAHEEELIESKYA